MPQLPTILITGATDGIGLALAQHYAQQGARLILIGRRALATLQQTFFTDENYCQVDLAQSGYTDTAHQWLHEKKITQLDLLIHNAGLGWVGNVADQPADSIRQLVAVNLQAPIALTHALLPLVAAAHGKLVFISSVASALPGARYAVYTASKAALDGFVRNLQIELKSGRSGVTAQVIHPGATRTAMHAKSGATRAEMDWEKFPTAQAVAQQIAQAIQRPERAVTIGATNSLVRFTGRALPSAVEWAMRPKPLGHAPDDTGPHCLITGAADGIGRALAFAFAGAGYRITGVDVDAERATATTAALRAQGATVEFLIANLGDAAEVAQVAAQVAAGPALSVVIHNAGINAVGSFAHLPLAKQSQVIDINLTAPLLLTAALLRAKKLAPGSSLAFIASLSHYVGYPGAAVYAASKDGLVAYARSLAVALAPKGIQLLTIFPGPTRTAHARRYSPDNRREQSRMPPEELARQILQAVQRRQRLLIPGVGNQLFAWAGWLLPSITEQLMRRMLLDKLVRK